MWFIKQMKEMKRIREERQEMIEILRMTIGKEDIREIIEQSMTHETSYGKKVRNCGPRKRRRANGWMEGRRKLVMRDDGLVWMLPQEVPEEIT